jgi:hypothetical protein
MERLARRTVEVALGLMLWVWVPLGLTLIAVGSFVLVDGERNVVGTLVMIGVSVVLTPFCAITGWRLLTGRERRGGGLLNPAMVDYATAAVSLLYASRANLLFGPELARRESEAAAEALGRARGHWRKRPKGARRKTK